MILTSQGHLSTAGGREGYLSIASTSGGYPFDSAEMTLLYFSLKIVPRPQRKTARDNFHTQFNATIFTHPHRSTCTVRHEVHSQERHSRCRCRSLSQELQLATQIHQMISSVTVCVWMHVQKTERPSTPSLAKVWHVASRAKYYELYKIEHVLAQLKRSQTNTRMWT